MADIETDEYKALRLKYERLSDEQEQLPRVGFAKVFEALDGLEEEFIPQHPYTKNEDNINKALELTGHSADEAFCKAFKRNNQIMIEGKDIQANGLMQIAKESYEQIEEPKSEQKEWRFYPISIIASPELHPIINEIVANDAENGTGLFSNKTDIEHFDEKLDEYFDCEAYGLKCSTQPFMRELERYGVIVKQNIIASDGLPFTVVLQAIKQIMDFIKEHSTEPNKVRNYIAERVKIFDSIPVWGLFYQILILQGLCEWCNGVSAKIEGQNGYNDVKELWLWVEKQLIDKEVAFIYTPYGEADKVRLKPLCDYLYNTELGRTIQETIFKIEELEPEPKQLPKKLDNPTAEKLFDQIVALGYCERFGCSYRWTGTAALFGYFVEVTSNQLKIRPSNNRLPWKIYKEAFNCSDKMIATAKQAVNDYNNKDLPKPDGYSEILELCN